MMILNGASVRVAGCIVSKDRTGGIHAFVAICLGAEGTEWEFRVGLRARLGCYYHCCTRKSVID
jgi:hypothetical protein